MIPNIIVIDLTQFGSKPATREDYFNKLANIRKFLVELGIPTNLDTQIYLGFLFNIYNKLKYEDER